MVFEPRPLQPPPLNLSVLPSALVDFIVEFVVSEETFEFLTWWARRNGWRSAARAYRRFASPLWSWFARHHWKSHMNFASFDGKVIVQDLVFIVELDATKLVNKLEEDGVRVKQRPWWASALPDAELQKQRWRRILRDHIHEHTPTGLRYYSEVCECQACVRGTMNGRDRERRYDYPDYDDYGWAEHQWSDYQDAPESHGRVDNVEWMDEQQVKAERTKRLGDVRFSDHSLEGGWERHSWGRGVVRKRWFQRWELMESPEMWAPDHGEYLLEKTKGTRHRQLPVAGKSRNFGKSRRQKEKRGRVVVTLEEE